MQAFFAHRDDLCRICKDLPPPRATVFVQKHNGTRIREAQLFGGKTLLCFAKNRIPFILLITAPGIRAFSAGRSVGSLSSVCRSASGLHFVKSSGQGRNQARAAVLFEGRKFPENNKKRRRVCAKPFWSNLSHWQARRFRLVIHECCKFPHLCCKIAGFKRRRYTKCFTPSQIREVLP